MNQHPSRGFTLTELAIVLIIVALLAGGLVVTLSSQMLLRDTRETDQTLAAATEALIGFAATSSASEGSNPNNKPYLPCPDRDGDGKADPHPSNYGCLVDEGFFPWADLGVGQKDAWNNRLRYRVHQNFANRNTGFTLTTTVAGATVCESVGCSSGTDIAQTLPAIIISHGQNGYGATSVSGIVLAAPTGADELENTNGNMNYVSHTPTHASAPNGEFDDRVIWLSPYILFSRMIAAGRLP